jgi:4-amino-4-deoxy-L-arabinose transferase-like glycosyltransferase
MFAASAGAAAGSGHAPEATAATGGGAPETRSDDSHFVWWLVAAMALGLVIRFAYAIAFKWNNPVGGDAAYYHFQANALARGLGFVDPWSWAWRKTGVFDGAEHPPLYTMFLSIPSLLGFDTVREHLLSGGILGSVAIGAIGFAGRAVAGARAGIIAAFIAAVYANLFMNDGLIISETLTALLVALVVWFVYRFWRAPSMGNAALLGAACGLITLTRAELVLYFPIVVLPLALRARGLVTRERVQRLVVMVVIAAIPVLPWVGYNLSRFNEPVTLSTGGDFTLANTYCRSTFYGDRVGWWDLRCMGDRWSVPGDESEVAKHFRQQGLDYLSGHLGRFPVVLLARVARMWDVYAPIQKLNWDTVEQGRSPIAVAGLALGQFYALVIAAIVGLVMLRRRKVIIYPLLGLAVTCTLAAMIAFGSTRYRVPAEIAIIIAASVPLAALLDRWFPSGRHTAPPSSGEEPVAPEGPAPGDGTARDVERDAPRSPEPVHS